MKPVILYYAFGHPTPGGRFADNPRAVYEEFVKRDERFRHVWHSYRPQRFPEGVEVVVPGTAQYDEVLAQTEVVVANAYWEAPVPPNPFLYLQTWHGTPLKRLCHDARLTTEEGLRWIDDDIARWDFLLSPNRFSTQAFRSGFKYEGPVWESGYPRNDKLLAEARQADRRVLRQQFGLEDGQTAVLYAPTWRDLVKTADGMHGARLELDVDDFTSRLGDDHVLLLRLHYLIANKFDFSHPRIQDVSDYPETSDLYLASDVLVTDYSSVMFDFAITGKPMIFFAYDLNEYRDDTRGFYFDFTENAPGPLVSSTAEVIDCLLELDQTASVYADAYLSFQEQFCHLDDGKASTRVVDQLISAYESFSAQR